MPDRAADRAWRLYGQRPDANVQGARRVGERRPRAGMPVAQRGHRVSGDFRGLRGLVASIEPRSVGRAVEVAGVAGKSGQVARSCAMKILKCKIECLIGRTTCAFTLICEKEFGRSFFA